MMLHRHFEEQKSAKVTKLADVSGQYVSEVFPPEEEAPSEAPKKRRQKKTAE